MLCDVDRPTVCVGVANPNRVNTILIVTEIHEQPQRRSYLPDVVAIVCCWKVFIHVQHTCIACVCSHRLHPRWIVLRHAAIAADERAATRTACRPKRAATRTACRPNASLLDPRVNPHSRIIVQERSRSCVDSPHVYTDVANLY